MALTPGPWWLVRKGRIDDAKRALERLARPGYYDERKLDAYVAVMKHTDDLDRAEAAKGSYKECFQGTNLRRTEIVSAAPGAWLTPDVRRVALPDLGRSVHHLVRRRLVSSPAGTRR